MTKDTQRVGYKPGIADLAVLVVLFTPYFLKFGHFADDPGVGWHLETGRWIAENAAIPRVDPFLASSTARPWVSDQWLSDVLFHAIYAQFSWIGLYATLTAVFLALYFGIVLRTAAKAGGTWLGAAFAAMCALKLSTIHFILRPVMLGFVMFALVFAVCASCATRMREDPDFGGGPLLKRLLVLPPLFALWANLHPSFVLGLTVVAILAIAFHLEPYVSPDARAERARWNGASARAAAVLVGCGIATLLNPWGAGLHESIFALAGNEFFARFNSEWYSPDFLEGSGQLAVLLFFFIAGSRVLDRGEGQRLTLFEFGALAALTIGYLRSMRLLPFLAVVLAVPIAIAAKNLAKAYVFEWMDELAKLRSATERLERYEARSARGVVGLGLSVAVLVGVVASGSWPREVEFGPTHYSYPHGAIEFLVGRDEPATVFTTPNYGGFITMKGQGRVKAYIDDRNTMLGEQFYRDHAAIAGLRDADWLQKLRETRADYLLVKENSIVARTALATGMPSAYSDGTWQLFEVD